MPILSRRSIQKIIHDISEIIESDKISQIVKKLNKEDIQSLDALWEIIVISLLSRHGRISYELNYGGNTSPDIFFENEKGDELVADITCITDKSQNEANDCRYFNDELASVAKKLGINTLSGFDIKIESDGNHKRAKLKLPSKAETRPFIKSKIKSFLIEISQNKEQPRSQQFNEGEIELSISYNPNSGYLTFGYDSFTVAKSLRHNPLYRGLHSKRLQLRDCGFHGLKGVIICDGGCDLLTSTMPNSNSYGADSVINDFLQSQGTISFVIAIYIEEHINNMSTQKIKRKFSLKYAAKDNCRNVIDDLTRKLTSSTIQLPNPISTPKNASAALKNERSFPGNTSHGGYSMSTSKSESKITISARTLLNLMIGKISSEQMIADYNNGGIFLKNKIEQGYELNSMSLIKVAESDDDLVELSFGSALDPAVSKYTST